MPMGQMNRLLDHVRRAALCAPAEQVTDGELLDRFIARRDEAAFEALVRRHGPMVLGVCRRVIGNCHDAEDAFQVTFLVLVRKAATVRPRQAVGNWLYGVAYRTALEARGRIARRRAREKQVMHMPHPRAEPAETWPALRVILDGELNRLSDKYRLPVVLCDLEGRSRKEVARQLAIPEGTLSSRLASARKMLARRLARYGLGLSGVSLAVLLTEGGASAAVPAALVAGTTRSAMLLAAGHTAVGAGVVSLQVTALMEGVLKAMLLTKVKTVTAVLCGITILGIGSGGVWYQARAGGAGSPGPRQQQVGRDPGKRSIQVDADGGLLVARKGAPANPTVRLEEVQEELARAIREVRELKEQLEKERQRAEAERERFQAVMQELQDMKKRVAQAQGQAQRTRYGNQLQRAAEEWGKVHPDQQAALSDLEQKKKQALESFDAKRQALTEQLKYLESQQQKEMADYDREHQALIGELKERASQSERSRSASGDKLDRILERLEQIERRLDRLESKSGRGLQR